MQCQTFVENQIFEHIVVMEQKKISFGFNKTIKRLNVFSKPKEKPVDKVELIKCVEGQSIKLLNQESKVEDKLLIIPMKDNRRTSAALASLKIRQEVLNGIVDNATDEKHEDSLKVVLENQEDNIEQKAVRELLKEARGEDEESTISNLTLPVKSDELPLEGAAESNLENYENIPISQFGLAMLRGMGWKEEGKKISKGSDEPTLRPKGMGLGADKVLARKTLLVLPEANEKLEIKKDAYVRILGGKQRDLYGQIEGLDDHAGRIIVKMALGGNRESLNEFLVQPVSKREYSQYSKVINSAKYEEFKKMENEYGQIIIKSEHNIKSEKDSLNGSEKRHKKDESDVVNLLSSDSDEKSRLLEKECIGRALPEEDIKQSKIKKEGERRDHLSTSRSSKHSSATYDERSRSRKISPQIKQSTSRRDHQSRRRDTSTESSDTRTHHKSKKKSKSKTKDRSRHRHDSSDDEKRHKKKTKKSKRPRSRSRERR